MTISRIQIEPYVAEYAIGKYYDKDLDAVRFPPSSDIYHLIYDLMARRPGSVIDRGNLPIALPDRREANVQGGKSPENFNWFSERSSRLISDRLKLEMWAEVHEWMMDQKHMHGVQYKDSVWQFLQRYAITSISEDALIKNYYRWREKVRRQSVAKKKPKFP